MRERFINRWHNLSSHCPQPITEPEAVLDVHEQPPSRNGCILVRCAAYYFRKIGIKGHEHRKHYLNHLARRSKSNEKATEKKE